MAVKNGGAAAFSAVGGKCELRCGFATPQLSAQGLKIRKIIKEKQPVKLKRWNRTICDSAVNLFYKFIQRYKRRNYLMRLASASALALYKYAQEFCADI